MSELAYMVRKNWAQHGTAMVAHGAKIRDWIGEEPNLLAVTDVKKFNYGGRNTDIEETAQFMAPTS
jgi:hypothetical protein